VPHSASADPALEQLRAESRAHYERGELASAERLCLRILGAWPSDFASLLMLGAIATSGGRRDEAVAYFTRATASQPDAAVAHHNLGIVLLDLRRAEEALASFERALALAPGQAETYCDRAGAHQALQHFDAALADLSTALSLNPRLPRAHSNRGTVLHGLGRLDEALASYNQAISLRPDYALAHSKKAATLLAMKRPDDALKSCERAIRLDANLAVAHVNRGAVLDYLGRRAEAGAAFATAVRLDPRDPAAQNGYAAYVAWGEGRFDDARRGLEHAIELDPAYAEGYFNLALLHLLAGDFARAWPLYEWRKRLPDPIGNRRVAARLWLGAEPIAGQRLLLHAEQGLGDTIQFARLALDCRALGADVTLAVPRALVRLIRTMEPTLPIVRDDEPLPVADFHCPLLSLPLALKLDGARIPAPVPYLRAEPERVQHWADAVGPPGFRIGVAWHGNTKNLDHSRFFPLAMLRDIAALPGVRLISLQHGEGTEQLASLPGGMRVETLGEDFDAGGDAFIDSAAVLSHLDLVIAADSALGHLAGALGRPVWLALKRHPDWRWQLGRPDSPWYPAHRLFRQATAGVWDDVFAAMTAELARLLEGKPPAR
jgi:tetratricopeptide (TPR) repeat protein